MRSSLSCVAWSQVPPAQYHSVAFRFLPEVSGSLQRSSSLYIPGSSRVCTQPRGDTNSQEKMPPKRPKNMGDIRDFLSKQTDSPSGSSSRATMQPEGPKSPQGFTRCVKKENDSDFIVQHSHEFIVKFDQDSYEYTVQCDQLCTVLEAIKSNETCNEKIKCADENIIIQLGKEDKKSSVATHFPCSCIDDGECLIISCRAEKVEGEVQHSKIVHPKEHYSVFYIDTVGGLHTKTKELFKNNDVKQFKNLCVYGEKGITVAEALKRDGRFIDDLGNFELSNNQDPKRLTVCTQKVEILHQKQFKIRLPKDKKKKNYEKLQERPSDNNNNCQSKCENRSESEIIDLARQEGIRVKTVKETSSDVDRDKIYELLREQFPDLKRWMETRFPGDSFQEELNLRKQNFGKIQQSFSQVYRVRKLLELGKSVCKVVITDVSTGTGFVLFDTFILTSAHLFKGYVEGKKLQQDREVLAIFDYEEPEPEKNFYYFRAENTFIDFDADLDYAVLELNPEGSKPNQQKTAQKIKVPPGLLSEFGPLPANGEACIIGHPAGRVKEMDPTFIIEIEKRGQAAADYLSQYKHQLIINSLSDHVRKQGIENILQGGHKAGKVGTYNTFMYHGASGSPVFNGLGKVFGLHTAGYTYGFTKEVESVIEYAHPLIMIFKKFVNTLKESKNEELLKRVEEEAKENKLLTDVLNIKQVDPVEQMEVSSSD
ncbi:serine protease FAM111A-like [Simochromis diagramma]|uniref:serine protease FAM111A-like n=1 Tax=Simochromis diagramma TaxID=43689 RepID=UPI001A7EE4B7|nr:serine protease FAM111A-like [Simochromis diagramma]